MFNFILPGYNLRTLEMSGAIGVEQLKKLDNFVKIRQINAQHFRAGQLKFESQCV